MTGVTTRHNGSQRVTSPAKTYINMVSLGHKVPHKSQMLMAGVAQEPCDPGHNRSQRITTGHKPSEILHKHGFTGSQSTSQIADFDGRSGTGQIVLNFFSRPANFSLRRNVWERSFACVVGYASSCGLQIYVSSFFRI